MMDDHTGIFAVYYLYRSRYAFVADHELRDGHHVVQFGDLEHAIKFIGETNARDFITDELGSKENASYFLYELTLEEVLLYCEALYELRRSVRHHHVA